VVRWRQGISLTNPGGLQSSPVLDLLGTRVFIGTSDNKLISKRTDNGATVWEAQFPKEPNGATGYVEGTPLVLNGRVYVGSDNGIFFALDVATKRQVWQFKVPGTFSIHSSAVPSPDGSLLYFGADGGIMRAMQLDGPDAGKVQFSISLNGYIDSTAAVDRDGTVYVGTAHGTLYSLTPYLTLRWAFSTRRMDAMINAAPTLDGNNVYVGSYDNTFYALNKRTGAPRWTFATQGIIQSSAALSVDGKTLFFGSTDANVYAVSTTGSRVWSFKTGGFSCHHATVFMPSCHGFHAIMPRFS
jgi:outer membrane protein assembly factor BamB